MSLRRLLLLGGAPIVLALGLACARDKTPSASDDPQIVAAYRGGVVGRAEFDTFEQPQLDEDPQVATGEERDWRVVRISEIVLRKVLESEVPADDPEPGLQSAVDVATASILRDAMGVELGWSELSVTPEEIREQYDTHPEQYIDPEKLRLQHIFLRAETAEMSAAERDEVRQRLDRIREDILAGADFGEMARQHSQSETASSGGWMSLRADADVFPAFGREARSLELEEVSEIIDTPTGFQLVKLVDRIPALTRKFEDVVEFARRRALQAKLDAAREAFVREVGPRYGLEKRYERLADPFISEDEALITVGDEHYRFSDLTAELSEHYMMQLYNAHFPKVYEFLDEVARNRLLVLEAKRLELSQREAVAAQIEAATRALRYEQALARRLERKASEVPEATLREYFQQNEKRYQTLRTRDLDVVLLKPEPEEPLWLTLKRAEDLVRRIRAGEDFAEIARAHSSHYSAANGGRIERLTDPGVVRLVQPRFQNLLNSLADGEISDPVVAECYDPDRLRYLQTGVIFVRSVKVYPPKQASFEEVEDMVRASYLRRYYKRLEDEVRQEVLESADLEIYFDHLPPI